MRILRKIFKPLQGNLVNKLLRLGPNGLLIGAFGSVTVMATGTAVGFLNVVLLTNILGPGGFGIYSLALAIVLIIYSPIKVGLSELVMREVAASIRSENTEQSLSILRWSYAVGGGIALAITLVFAAGIYASAAWLSPAKQSTMLWASTLVAIGTLVQVNAASLRGMGRVIAGHIAPILLRPALLTAALLCFVAMDLSSDLTPAYAMGLHVGATVGALIFAAWLNWQTQKSVVAHGTPIELPKEHRADPNQKWGRSLTTFALLASVAALQSLADILVLGILTDDATVGIYRAAAQGLALIVAAITAIQLALSPSIARAHAGNDLIGIQKIITTGGWLITLLLPVAVIMGIFASPLISLVYSPAFASGHTSLTILALGTVFYALFGLAGPALNMCGYEKDTLKGGVIGVICNIALNFTLIGPLGMEGAAIATVTGIAITQGVWAYLLWQRTGIKPWFLGKPSA